MTETALRPTNVRWRILAILMFISFVSYMLRGNLSIAAPAMIEDLQLTEIQWGWIMAAFPLGYALFQCLPGKSAVYGRYCDLNYGRVLAAIMAGTSVLAVLASSVWLQNVAFLLLVTFWLQGLAILHWLHTEKHVPALVLIGTYVLMVPLIGILMIAFSVLGYLDAWFNFRARNMARQA